MREREIANRSNADVCGSRERGVVFFYAWMKIRLPREKIVLFVSEQRKSTLENRQCYRERESDRKGKGEGEYEKVGCVVK